MSHTIIIADDHPLLLNGIEQFLTQLNYQVVNTALDGLEAYNRIVRQKPTFAILDYDMPKLNALEIAHLCLQKKLDTKIIILTLYKEERILKEVGNSIHGYVLKNDALKELESCINDILNEKTYISKNLNESIHLNTSLNQIEDLSPSEFKILKYLANNASSSQIADELFISKRTVEKHRSNIHKKLNIPSGQNTLLLWVKNNPKYFEK
jgi:DNA-binding NarL/FixJ family response regulator